MKKEPETVLRGEKEKVKEKFWMWLIDLVHGARFKDSHEKALSNNVALREFRMNQVGHLKNVQNGKASWNIYLDR